MKTIRIVIFFLACINLSARFIAPADDPTKANGPDMENPQNVMFQHSQNIFPNDKPTIRYFQTNDGSLINGIYDQATQKAQTDRHSYTNVIQINGTQQAPNMNDKNQYTDQKGKLLEYVGIFNEYNENQGETQIFYLFGQISGTKQSSITTDTMQNNAQPLINYYSYSAENDGYPGVN